MIERSLLETLPTSGQVNDRLFFPFVAGWFVGIVAGGIYGGFYWDDLKVELGRTVLVAVTTSQFATLLLTTLVVRRNFPHGDCMGKREP